MVDCYSLNLGTRFQFFNEDEDVCDIDPEEIVERAQEEQRRKEEDAKKAKEAQKKADKKAQLNAKKGKLVQTKTSDSSLATEKKVNTTTKDTKPQTQQTTRGPLNQPPRMQRLQQQRTKPDDFIQQQAPAPTAVRGGRGGFRGGRGAGRGGSSGNSSSGEFKKREFDRHSGSDKTGVKAMPKREGAGGHNWGTIEDELNAENVLREEQEKSKEATDSGPEGGAEAAAAPAEPKTMTLQEFRAKQGNKPEVPAKVEPARKANDGENVFTGMQEYRKPAADSDDEDSNDGLDVVESKSHAVPIAVKFSGNASRGRGRFSNRGDERPVQNNAAPAKPQVNINLSNDDEFPSLK